ncbi:hypothetical protein SELMODRAFT_424896 [Selaginella moellendorffii]|uniref:Uncharacterized protein n=1 Tax=Selaginella moellendorffii TaxID=88036 RepID=D8SRC7_SELML|nr:hypothetical protein SELMODRAFT_424896 [Selaginella moellendorffii]
MYGLLQIGHRLLKVTRQSGRSSRRLLWRTWLHRAVISNLGNTLMARVCGKKQSGLALLQKQLEAKGGSQTRSRIESRMNELHVYARQRLVVDCHGNCGETEALASERAHRNECIEKQLGFRDSDCVWRQCLTSAVKASPDFGASPQTKWGLVTASAQLVLKLDTFEAGAFAASLPQPALTALCVISVFTNYDLDPVQDLEALSGKTMTKLIVIHEKAAGERSISEYQRVLETKVREYVPADRFEVEVIGRYFQRRTRKVWLGARQKNWWKALLSKGLLDKAAMKILSAGLEKSVGAAVSMNHRWHSLCVHGDEECLEKAKHEFSSSGNRRSKGLFGVSMPKSSTRRNLRLEATAFAATALLTSLEQGWTCATEGCQESVALETLGYVHTHGGSDCDLQKIQAESRCFPDRVERAVALVKKQYMCWVFSIRKQRSLKLVLIN